MPRMPSRKSPPNPRTKPPTSPASSPWKTPPNHSPTAGVASATSIPFQTSPAQREALTTLLPEVTDFYSSLSLNPRLFNVLNTVAESDQIASLTEIQKRHIEETIEDFKNSGAALPDDKKTRIATLDSELSLATKEYAEHVLDSTNAWELIITDKAKLDGLPDSAIASAAANAQSKDHPEGSYRFTLQFPSMYPVLQHAHDEDLRKTIWKASSEVAAQTPHDNSELVWKILTLRQEKAEILGHINFADLTLQRRMARNGHAALAFVEQLHDRIKTPFLEEAKQLSEYKASKTNTPAAPLEPWEGAYYAEMQRQEKYDLDDEVLRPYFPVKGVMDGMFTIAQKSSASPSPSRKASTTSLVAARIHQRTAQSKPGTRRSISTRSTTQNPSSTSAPSTRTGTHARPNAAAHG